MKCINATFSSTFAALSGVQVFGSPQSLGTSPPSFSVTTTRHKESKTCQSVVSPDSVFQPVPISANAKFESVSVGIDEIVSPLEELKSDIVQDGFRNQEVLSNRIFYGINSLYISLTSCSDLEDDQIRILSNRLRPLKEFSKWCLRNMAMENPPETISLEKEQQDFMTTWLTDMAYTFHDLALVSETCIKYSERTDQNAVATVFEDTSTNMLITAQSFSQAHKYPESSLANRLDH
ncbi:hypothetical protein IE53DRAFT_85866 [Violaceomyces palustris]|uniref:Uncharacterized protein n=1 Tax=Violaceomyces palustris TaxID=1673888 RepID=A0ACD0NXU2_9BASI|nr:hypothetical protein IE53DRAFT_85866 [Violaceomyces palustris]